MATRPKTRYKIVYGEASAPTIVPVPDCDPDGISFKSAKRIALAFIAQQLRFWSFRLDAMLTHTEPNNPDEPDIL